MALEDTLGVPPPDYDTIQNTNDLTDIADRKLNADPQTIQTRMARKGLVGASDVNDPIESTHQLTLKAREMIDKMNEAQQPAPTVMPAPNDARFGPMIDQSGQGPIDSKFGPQVPTANTVTPVSDKEGGGVSASGGKSTLQTFESGLGQGLVGGIGSAMQAPAVAGQTLTQAVKDSMAAGAVPGAEGMPSGMTPEAQAEMAKSQLPSIKEGITAPLYHAGERTKAWAEKNFPMTPEEKSSISGRLGTGVGGFFPAAAGIIAGSAAGGPLGGTLAGAATIGLTSAADTFDEAMKHEGVTEEQAARAAGIAGPLNAVLGTLPLGAVLSPLKKIAPELMGPAAAALAKVGMDGYAGAAVKGGVAFATVGEAQEYIAEQIAKAYYDPKAGYDPDARRIIASLLLGGAIGAGAHALHGETPARPEAPPGATAGPEGLPPPGGGAGPGPTPGESGPAAGPSGGGQTFSPRKRALMETVAESYARQNGDKHTAADIRSWSDDQLYQYVQSSWAKAGPQAKNGEGEKTQQGAETWKPGSDEHELSINGFTDYYIKNITPLQRKQQADLLRGVKNQTSGAEKPPAETTEGPRPGTREKPITVTSPEDVLKAGAETVEPTPGQAEAENHKSGHAAIPELGLTGKNTVTIETPVGGTRKGPLDEKTGEHAWQVNNYPYAYGRAKGIPGADGQNLDVAIGPGGSSFIIDQNDPKTGAFDEHKLFANWPSAEAARAAYLSAYEDHDAKRIRAITPITKDQLWAHDWSKKEPYAKDITKPAETTGGPRSKEAQEGLSELNDLFGGSEQPQQTEMAADHPTAEPLADIKAQLASLHPESGHHWRKGVWLPKASVDHAKAMGVDFNNPPSGLYYAKDFDGNGGVMMVPIGDRGLIEQAIKSGQSPQKIIGFFTGSGEGKPANGTHVVQRRDKDGHVTRESLVTDADLEKIKKEFGFRGGDVHVLTPQEALKRREDMIAQELSAKEKPAETETQPDVTTGEKPQEETGSDAHDHVKTIEDALSAGGIDPRNVNQADIRRAAELLADGSATDPTDAFTRAVAENAVHQGYATQEEITHVFGEEVGTVLERDEERPSVSGGATAQEGTTTGPRLAGGAEENSEPHGGGETGGVEAQGSEGHEVAEVKGGEITESEGTKPGETTTVTEPAEITTGLRGGIAEPEHPVATHDESGDTGAAEPTTGVTGERPAGGEPTTPTHEPPITPETTGGGGRKRGKTEPAETGENEPAGNEIVEPEAEEEEKAKIEDESGEKLRGSRKEIWALLHGKNEGITEEDLGTLTGPEKAKYLTKENIWKRPDYAALVNDNKVEAETAALLKRIYDRLPKTYHIPRFSQWTEAQAQEGYVKALRAIRNAISDAKTTKELRDKAEQLGKDFKDTKIEQTPVLHAANSAKEYYSTKNPAEYTRQDLRVAERMIREGFPNIEPWQRVFSVNEQSIWDAEKRLYVKTADGTYAKEWQVWRRTGNVKMGTFPTKEAATEHAKALYAESGRDSTEGVIPERPHLDKLERKGPDHRKGADIASGDDFIKEFGFRGSQFGNWVTSQGERQQMLNLAWDALHDLAYVLNMSPKAMSLDGTLGIAFGARGKGGRGAGAAHYEPLERVINMTRLNGAGSLAHELFGHAFDHYLGNINKENKVEGAPNGISGWYTQPNTSTYKDNLYRLPQLPPPLRKAANELMQALFFRPETTEEILKRLTDEAASKRKNIEGYDKHIAEQKVLIAQGKGSHSTLKRYQDYRNQWVDMLNTDLKKIKEPERYKTSVETNYFQNAKKLSGKSGDYWKRPTEMFARAAESFVFDELKSHGRMNDYLVQGVEGDRFRTDGFGASGGGNYKGNPYPRGEERTAINLLFKQLVKAMKAENGKFEGSKIGASDYERENQDNVYDVIETAKGPGVRERLIAEALALAGATEKAVRSNLSDAFAEHMEKDGFSNILMARKFAAERGFDMNAKKIEEELELGMVKLARKIVETNNSEKDVTYAQLVEAYGRQPRLSTRTSTSMRDQAYSTPIPLAYIASRLAGITPATKVYEPTAGNGALLIESKPSNVTANEYNRERAANLKELGYVPTEHNALSLRPDSKYDVVIANPPFGTVEQETNGNPQVFDLSKYLKNYSTTQVDHAIALKALDTLKNDGRAVLIVGSVNKMNVDEQDRFQAYQAENKRLFYKALYDNYRVKDHFTVSGHLYEKQGAGWPVDVIVIDGRGTSDMALPAVNLPVIFNDWEALKGLLNGQTSRELSEAAGAGAGTAAGFGATGGHGAGGGKSSTGGPRPKPKPVAEDEPVGVQSGTGGGLAGEPTDEGRGPSGLSGAEGELPGGDDFSAGAEPAEQRASGVEVSREEIDKAVDDAIDALFRDEEPGVKAPNFRDDGKSSESPQEPPKAKDVPGFDPNVYEKAKSSFTKAAQDYPDLFNNLAALAGAIVRDLKSIHKWGNEQLKNMAPYIKQFLDDVRTGVIKLVRPKTERAAPGQHQVKYTPVAEGKSLDTQAPANLNEAMQRGLRKIQQEVGPLTDYVSGEMGWTKDQLGDFLGAEQIDALAQAIYNAKNNSAAINGDQTGIGKGRVAASILQWAHRNKKVPVFVTDNPALFADIYRDLKATGFLAYLGRKPKIFTTNAMPAAMPLDPDDATAVLKRSDAKAINAAMAVSHTPELVRDNYDLVFTSYPQLALTAKGEPERRGFLRMISPNAVMVFDESHNAAGEAEVQRGKKPKEGEGPPPPNRAGFAREMVDKADSVAYLSATYAKNPKTMVFYSKTNMRLAVTDPKDLPELFARGGIPLQQIAATGMAEDGQFLRRERDFTGINYDTVKAAVNHESYDDISKTFGDINDLANFVKQLVKDARKLGGQIAGGGGSILPDNATGDESVEAVGFASILHNAVSQMLLAMKAGPAAAEAIAAIKRGEKPILGLYNTMESFLSDYVETENDARMEAYNQAKQHYEDGMISETPKEPDLLGPGSPITVSFKDILLRYLNRARTIRIKDAEGNTTKVRLTDEQLGQEGLTRFNKAKAQIEAAAIMDMPISPLDAIMNDIKKAGYRIGEISGRGMTIDYSGNVPKLASRPAGEGTNTGKIKTVSLYNTKPENDGIHAIIMNQAGSTGLSMHAHIGFNDQSKRHMIIVQPAPDINIHMQMLGRINRTGQVVLPTYTQLVADVPAEARPAGLLSKKMASLNANTTAAREGALTSKDEDLPDFMNQYGDEIASQFLMENPHLNRMMDEPLKIREDGTFNASDTMHRLTGKLALVYPSKLQGDILDRLRDEYNALIEQKNAANENALEATVLDLQARPSERTEVMPAKADTDSRFGTAVSVERAKVRRLVKPLSHKEIAHELEKATGIEGLAGKTMQETADNLQQLERSSYDDPHRVKLQDENKKALDAFRDFRKKELDAIDDPALQENARVRLDKGKDQWSSLRNMLLPGTRWSLAMDDGVKAAVVLHLDHKGKSANPLALSTWRATFATAQGARTITLPFSRLFPTDGSGNSTAPPTNANAIDLRGRQNDQYSDTLGLFEALQNVRTEQRYLITGNILAGFDWLDGKGRITHYTDYRGETRQGIIAPQDFDFAAHTTQKGSPIKSAEELKESIDKNRNRKHMTADGAVSIQLDPNSYYRKNYQIDVISDRQDGGIYYLNKDLVALVGGDFTSRRVTVRKAGRDVNTKMMSAVVSEDRIIKVINKLVGLGADFRIDRGDRKTVPVDTSDVPDPDEVKPETPPPGTEPPPDGGTSTANIATRPPLTPEASAKYQQITGIINRAVDQMLGPNRTAIRWETPDPDKVSSAGWAGQGSGEITAAYDAQHNFMQLSVNIDDPLYMASNAFHETYHAVQNLLLNDRQRALMTSELPRLQQLAARDRGMPIRSVQQIAPYEVEAMAFEGYMRDRMRGGAGMGLHIGVKRAFEGMMQVLYKIKNGLKGLGFETYESIFDKVASGQLAQQPSRTDRPLMKDILATNEAFMREREGVKAPNFGDRVRDSIAKLFPYDKRVSATEIISDLSHREWLLQKEIEARYLGLTPEDVAKLYPAASKMPDAMQFYVNKRLMPGRIATNVKATNNNYVKPFIKAANDGKIDLDTVGEYIQAKGAEQRNAQISEAWRDRPGSDFYKAANDPSIVGGSGWSNDDAQNVIQKYENGPKGAYFRELWTRFKDMTKHDLELKLRYGLLTPEQVSEFMRRGDEYVPYKGFEDEPENAPDERGGARGPGPMGVRGKEYQEATGRRSRADNPAVHIIDQLYRTIDRGEQNAHYNSVAQALAETKAMGNDISDIARLYKVKTKRVIDKNTGLVRDVPDTGELNNPRTMHFKRRGKPMYVIFQSRPLAEAIKRTKPPFPKQLRWALIGVNKLKSLWTHYSPTFIPKHFARYYVEGLLNMSEYQGRANGNVSMTEWAKTAFPGLGKSSIAIHAVDKGLTTHADPDVRRMMRSYNLMKKFGGNQSFRAMRDLDGIRDELSRELDNLSTDRPIQAAKKSLRKVTDAIDHMFDLLTNAQQLSTFDQLIREGTPPSKAAYIARETNVDMQKNGLISHWAGLLFPFFRIAVNIGQRFSSAYKRSPNYRHAVHAMFMAGAGMALWNYIMGGNDKDGTPFFEKVPAWDRALNMIIMNPWHTDEKGRPMPYKMPMLFNWALPVTFGYHATGMALSAIGAIKSHMTVGEHLGDMVKSVLMAFTPVGEIGNSLDLFTPELLKGPAHVAENKNWQGRPLHMDEAFQKGPNAYSGKKDFQGRVRTGEAWKEIAQFINWASGGSKVKSGYVDMYPEDIRELVEQPFGAQIRLGQDVAKTTGSIMKGEVPKAKDIPLVKVFAGTDYDAADAALGAERYFKSKQPWKH